MTQTVRFKGKVYDAESGRVLSEVDQKRHAESRHTAHEVHSRTQSAKTLMRRAVSKPNLKSPAKPHHSEHANPTSDNSTLDRNKVYLEREHRAHAIAKSHLIKRFSDSPLAQSSVHKVHAVLPVRDEPAAHISHHHESPVTQFTPQSDVNFFAHALSEARTHKSAKQHHAQKNTSARKKLGNRAKALTISTTIASCLVLGGFFLWQNSANVEFRMAASRAGIQASLPNYQPSGFSIKGPVEFAPGEVVVHYSSNSDDREFSIRQQSSNWNSDALKESVAAASPGGFDVKEAKGRKVFIFNGNNATWVDGGIWYQIESQASLSTDQLLHIASSM